ncbi:histidine phosphatase family protein [uncultured Desulfobulbus sp.]|uniref:histidine phosphatase family protein n=1 Tax=uncultured Desulfobulbus sp. TaxID=239745 RepID=UPI0029C87986|nr:histidine phosphatase family protein [uncultured Desulfobulbus sp.]
MKTTKTFHFKPFWLGFLTVFFLIGSGGSSASQSPEIIWQALKRGEALALIRHSYAPGTSDPPGFLLRDCSTQRNLSEDGRIQSRKLGAFFRAQGINDALVYSSQWCRCLETANLLGLGPVEELPALNSFFEEPDRGPEQTAKIRTFLSTLIQQAPVILVTHQVNITALTGVVPSSGEIIIFQKEKNGLGKLLGRFIP